MAEHRIAWILLSLVGLGLAGCRGTPKPAARPEPPAKQAPAAAPSQAPSPAPAPTSPTPPDAPRENPVHPVVVDPGTAEDGTTPATLAEAAQKERERKARTAKPSIVINDKNLPRYARKGQITIADPKEKKKGTVAVATPPAEAHDEQYWRGRALEIRQRWRQAADDVKKLEQRSSELRQKFYMENDVFVRENRIKPDWDRVQDRLREARLDVDTVKQELDDFLEQGRQAGALPGWLREGEDQEPLQEKQPGKKKDLPSPQSIQPPELKDTHGLGNDDDHGGARR